MTKAEALERSVQLTHALLGLPDDLKIIAVDMYGTASGLWPDTSIIHIMAASAPATETNTVRVGDYDYHYRDLDVGIKLLWLTAAEEASE